MTGNSARAEGDRGPADSPTRGRLGRGLRRGAVVLVACVAMPTLLLYLMQDQLVYRPVAITPPIASVLPGGEEVTYRTDDGVEVHSWFLAAATDGSPNGRGSPTPVAVVFHGSNGERSSMAPYAQALARHGVAVLLAEYRGFGGVEGDLSESGLHLDGVAAVNYVRSRPGLDPNRVIYVGYSLGTGVAVVTAATNPPAALVLLAPYTSLTDVAWSRLPGLPYRLLMHAQFDSLARIAALHVPLLIMRGTNDHTVPPEETEQLFVAAHEPKKLVTIDGADHNLEAPGGPTISSATIDFVDQTLGAA